MRAPRSALVAVLLVSAACRREVTAGDDEQNLVAYAVKPAVVRINAYATAGFRYPIGAINEIEAALRADGHELKAKGIPADTVDAVVETGAGGSGSGFIVHPDGAILTSGHVVAPTRDAIQLRRELLKNGAIAALVRHFPVETLRAVYREEALDRHVARLAAAGSLSQIKVVTQVELSNGETLPYRIVRWSPSLNERGVDLALLQVDRRELPSLTLGDSSSLRIGQAIFAVGYPAVASSSDEVIGGWLSRESDLEATFNPGTITALKRNVANTPVLQSNVAIYRGNSGGPAVNARGDVVGISTWGHTDAEQIKFLVPVNVAVEFLAGAGVKPGTSGEFNRHLQASVEAAREGRWIAAREDLDRATTLFRGSPDLIRFRADADRGVASLPVWQRLPRIAVAAASGAGLALAGAVALLIVRRGRRKRPSIPPELLRNPRSEILVAPTGSTPDGSGLGKFTILNGARAGERLGLGGSGIRIGRESAICEIVLENPKISRLHAEVVSIDGKVLLIDRNSSNGTYVNDHKIDKRFLQDGDIIHFGGRNAVAVAFHA
jgi:serine protease Do